MDDGGKIVMGNVYEGFAKSGHEVHLVSIVNVEPANVLLESAKQFGAVSIFELETKNTLWRGIKSLFQNESTYISKHKSKRILLKVCQIAKEFQPDLIWAEHSNMAWYAIKAKELLGMQTTSHTALRMHNMEYIIWQRYAESLGIGPLKWFVSLQAKRLKKDEKRILDYIDYALPITSIDKDRAQRLSSTPKYQVMTSGVDREFLDYKSEFNTHKPKSLVIATSYKWIHNIKGLHWFIKSVMPTVVKEIPEAKLYLIGRDIPEELKEYKCVNAIGFVEDIKKELRKYEVYIAPLLVGGGIRIKILEAMALGLPVVATEISAEGIEAGREEGLFISDNPLEQAEAIINLMKDKEHREMMSDKSKDYIKNHHNWITIIQETVDFISKNS